MRTVIDIDDTLMAEAKRIFRTTTKKATVHRALQEAVDRQKRVAYASVQKGNPDWKPGAYEKLMARAWR